MQPLDLLYYPVLHCSSSPLNTPPSAAASSYCAPHAHHDEMPDIIIIEHTCISLLKTFFFFLVYRANNVILVLICVAAGLWGLATAQGWQWGEYVPSDSARGWQEYTEGEWEDQGTVLPAPMEYIFPVRHGLTAAPGPVYVQMRTGVWW